MPGGRGKWRKGKSDGTKVEYARETPGNRNAGGKRETVTEGEVLEGTTAQEKDKRDRELMPPPKRQKLIDPKEKKVEGQDPTVTRKSGDNTAGGPQEKGWGIIHPF